MYPEMSESYSTSTASQITSSVPHGIMHYGGPRRSDEGSKVDELDSELWHACAGPLTCLPPLQSLVVYWPQGHIEQVVACTPESAGGELLKKYKLPCKITCVLSKMELKADPQTDEVYAQMDLTPRDEKEISEEMKEPPPAPMQKNVHMFCKTLTASDTSTHGGFSVPRRAAEECLPQLDYAINPPCQELVAKDLHGVEWKFRHIYRGHPRRHLLTTGWSVFVSSKRLVAGDSVLFLRGENGELRVGVRRAAKQQAHVRSTYFCSLNLHLGVLAAAEHAAKEMFRFSVIYNPRTSPSEFVIPYHKFLKAKNSNLSVGSRFKMKFESEESSERRYAGTITGLGDADSEKWPDSAWRSVKVEWDESAASERHERVSPWEIEPFVPLSTLTPLSVGPRPKRRPPTLVTDSSPLGTSQSALDPFQSNKLARILQGHEPRNVGMNLGDDEEGDVTSSRTVPWVVKREPQRTGNHSWFSRPDNTASSDALCGLQSGVQRQEYIGLLNLKQSVEREKQQLRLCVQNHLRDQHKDLSSVDTSATCFQLSPRLSTVSTFAAPRPIDSPDLQLSVNSATAEQPPSSALTSMQWTSFTGPPCLQSCGNLPVHEPTCPTIPSWLSSHKPSLPSSVSVSASHIGAGGGLLLPSTSPNNEPTPIYFPAQTLSFEMWDKSEQEKISSTAPPMEQHCKLFGFDLTDKTAPVVVSAPCRTEDSEGSGPWPALDHSSPGCVDQQPGKPLSGVLQGHIAPVRSGTKVSQHGKVGRSIDLKKCESYTELRRMLASLFNLEGQLDDPSQGWQVVYTDHENDILLVGDDPWEEFCGCVRSLKILSPGEAVVHSIGKHANRNCEEEEWCTEYKSG